MLLCLSADEPWAYWWELVEMVRRVVLVGFFILPNRGSITQLVLGTVFSAIFLLFVTQVGPCASHGSKQRGVHR